MNSSNVRRTDENSNTSALANPLFEAAASVGAAPVPAITPQPTLGFQTGTFNPDPPFWDMIGKRGERDGWVDRAL